MLPIVLASVAWLAPLSLSTPSLRSDELKRERLPADVDFVLHFDLEGLKRTELWLRVAAKAGGEHRFSAEIEELDELEERFGIDPFTDVRAVTLFKTKGEEEPTVILFSATEKVDEALIRFQAEPGYARVVESGIELHTWKSEDDGETAYAYLHAKSGPERVVVLAKNKKSAVRAARVLRGEEPSHLQSGTLLTLAPAPGSFLYLAAAKIPHLDEFPPASRVFGLAQGIQVDLGEAGGFLRGHLGLTTGSPEDALNVSNVINGLISLGRLTGEKLGDLLELLTGFRINTRGSEVTLDFEYGVARLLEILESFEDEDSSDGAPAEGPK
jgi:hypothetical protein